MLGADLCDLVDALGSPVVSVLPVSRLPTPLSSRAAFKLCLADGRVLKGRRVESPGRCSALEQIASLLKDLPFTRGTAFQGASLLEQWMPGPSLTDERSTTERLREAGEILGRLHRTQIPSELAGQKLPNSERLLRAVERRLSSLNELGLLSSYEVSRLKHSAGQQLPYTLEDGLIHHDFCAENLIITVGNQLYAIDNEDMRIGVLDADLARTFHRWPMTSQQRQAFCEGYQRHREVVSYEGHSLFWLIWVLSGAIEFRAMRHLPCADLVVRMKQMFIGN